MEKWKEVSGTNGQYEVSNTGFLRTHNWKGSGQTRVMKPAVDACGYLRTMIVVNGRARTIKVHRLVAESWVENPEGKPQVNHKDGVKTNNHIDNLEWVTKRENIQHAFDNGLMKWNGQVPPNLKGSSNPTSKLTEDQVREIRSLHRPRIYTYAMLAAKFKVKPCTIKDVIHRTWKHIE